ncbi:restriction endonuclease subunit S [Limosilactobacillus caviae]|uniref:Restriction endonuclease subunit S n=1 Tax=Limosilactobacillus caviae TaxID=1769424 RepID=A0ABQ2CBM1_9LACO|nr:restriction endonuclease subunit S [Limosilactobacillus caviae]MCD7124051.1 restriction endonuclease subunit S [Limosilactobacillus caviae]MRH47196.1 hypothetical protein [Limosilactobacillus reuteri]GGI64179.1 restriction endonuclease subunit S [Limosilactobacillus caviae]
MKLKDVAKIESGKNKDRLDKKDLINQYTAEDALNDFYLMANEIENSSNIITFDLYSKANSYNSRVISQKNLSKIILNQKMCKITVDKSKISPYYLCYLLNEDDYIQKQKRLYTQGSFIERLKPSFLCNLKILLPSLEKQKLIGELYVRSIYQNFLKKKLADESLTQNKELLRQFAKKAKSYE